MCVSLSWPPLSCPPLLQVLRLSSQDVPTSYAYELEAATIVQVGLPAVCCHLLLPIDCLSLPVKAAAAVAATAAELLLLLLLVV